MPLVLVGICGLLSPNCQCYTKLKDLIRSSTCFLGLNQHNYPDNGCNLLDLVFFSNFADLSVDHPEHGPVPPDHFHNFITDCAMPVRRYKKSYKKYSSWHYLVLYNALSTYD
jgi:hypothetical protein